MSDSLLAASGDPTAEIGQLIAWTPRRKVPGTDLPGGRGSGRAAARDSRFGVRCGLLLPASSEWNSAFRAGVWYRLRALGNRPLEFGVDYSLLENRDSCVRSDVLSLRADLNWEFDRTGERLHRAYLTTGCSLAWEMADLEHLGEASRFVVPLNLGVGYGAASGRWDVRLVYSPLVGSTNVAGEMLLSFGVGF